MANNEATRKGAHVNDSIDGASVKGGVKAFVSTIELAASASGDTVDFGKIPSNARILDQSHQIYWDDLATSGTPDFDVGLKSYRNNDLTADPDALTANHDIEAAGNAALSKITLDTVGIPAWDLMNGVTSDPGGELEVYGSVTDAATTQTGTITLQFLYYTE